MSRDRARELVRGTVGYFVVALVCAVYVAGSLLVFVEGDRDVWQVLLDSFFVFLIGVCTNRAFEAQGMLNGAANERVLSTAKLHAETVIRIAPQMDRLDEWCAIKNAEALKFERIKVLSGEGLSYSRFFGADGEAADFERVLPRPTDKKQVREWKRKRRCYRRAVEIKITPLSSGALTSEGGRHDDPFYFGRTKTKYEAQSSARDVAVKIVTSVLFGYYGVEPLLNLNYGELLWRAWHVAIFILMGVIKMNRAYSFIVDEHRGRTVKKINYLEMFEAWTLKNALASEAEKEEKREECDNGESDNG